MPDDFYETIGYGDSLSYTILPDSLSARVNLTLTPTISIGSIILYYEYQDGQYTITDTEYQPYSDSNIQVITP